MDVGRIAESEALVAAVQAQFPKSMRARRLLAMQLEAAGELGKAEEVLDQILKEDALQHAARSARGSGPWPRA